MHKSEQTQTWQYWIIQLRFIQISSYQNFEIYFKTFGNSIDILGNFESEVLILLQYIPSMARDVYNNSVIDYNSIPAQKHSDRGIAKLAQNIVLKQEKQTYWY